MPNHSVRLNSLPAARGRRRGAYRLLVAAALLAASPLTSTRAQDAPKPSKPTPLNPQGTVLLDRANGRVLLKTEVVLRDGLLEMLCCRKQTKEHESILAVDAKAYVIHTALVALGADPGTPVKFEPKFQPPRGPIIDIYLNWKDKQGKPHRVRAQKWIQTATQRFYAEPLEQLPPGVETPKDSELRYDSRFKELVWFGKMSAAERDKFLALAKADAKDFRRAIQSFYERSQPREMSGEWVFAGSGVYVDEKTNERHYQAEGGDLICVANFPSAMIDISQKSSASGEQNLLFAPFTERIPPLGTPVTIELIPRDDSKRAGDEAPKAKSDSASPEPPTEK